MRSIGTRALSRRLALQGLGAAALAGLPQSGAMAEAKLVVGSLPFPNWCQLAAAEKFGWFKDEGIAPEKIDVKYFDSGPPEIEAAIGGNLQMMGIGAGPVINALATGALPLRILGSVNEATALFALVAQKGIETVKDLRGKTVACTLGANYQYFLEAALADAGLSAKDVTIVDADPNEGTVAFLAGRVDAVIPDYSTSKVIPRKREGAKVIVSGGDIGKSGGPSFRIFDLWVAPTKAFEANKAAIVSVVKATSHWADYYNTPATHEAALDFAATWGSKISGKAFSRDDIKASLDGARFFNAADQKKLADGGELATALTHHAEFLVRHGKLKSVPDFAAATERSIW
jgi:ABC-type nitrate/sulfonate/bicarbonate transport system substrate-binding protein